MLIRIDALGVKQNLFSIYWEKKRKYILSLEWPHSMAMFTVGAVSSNDKDVDMFMYSAC